MPWWSMTVTNGRRAESCDWNTVCTEVIPSDFERNKLAVIAITLEKQVNKSSKKSEAIGNARSELKTTTGKHEEATSLQPIAFWRFERTAVQRDSDNPRRALDYSAKRWTTSALSRTDVRRRDNCAIIGYGNEESVDRCCGSTVHVRRSYYGCNRRKPVSPTFRPYSTSGATRFTRTIQSYSFRSAYSLDGKIDDASKQSCSHSLRSRKIHDRRRGESTDNRWW